MSNPLSEAVASTIATKGLAIVDAAALCDLPASSMYALVQGNRGKHPTYPTLTKLAKGLGIPLAQLLTLSGRDGGAVDGHNARQEALMLARWRELSDRDQRVALTLIKAMGRL